MWLKRDGRREQQCWTRARSGGRGEGCDSSPRALRPSSSVRRSSREAVRGLLVGGVVRCGWRRRVLDRVRERVWVVEDVRIHALHHHLLLHLRHRHSNLHHLKVACIARVVFHLHYGLCRSRGFGCGRRSGSRHSLWLRRTNRCCRCGSRCWWR